VPVRLGGIVGEQAGCVSAPLQMFNYHKPSELLSIIIGLMLSASRLHFGEWDWPRLLLLVQGVLLVTEMYYRFISLISSSHTWDNSSSYNRLVPGRTSGSLSSLSP